MRPAQKSCWARFNTASTSSRTIIGPSKLNSRHFVAGARRNQISSKLFSQRDRDCLAGPFHPEGLAERRPRSGTTRKAGTNAPARERHLAGQRDGKDARRANRTAMEFHNRG